MQQLLPRSSIVDFLSTIYTSSPCNKLSVVSTGGGAQCMYWLFTVPGASNSLLHASIPYSRAANIELLHFSPKKSSSADTAIHMASAALKQTIGYILSETRDFNSLASSNVFAVACTAALVSFQPRRGLHRCHVAASSSGSSTEWSLVLEKGERSRDEEDYVCSRLILDAVAHYANCTPLPRDYLLPSTHIDGSPATENIVMSSRPKPAEAVLTDIIEGRSTMSLFIRRPAGWIGNSDGGLSSEFAFYEDAPLPPRTIVYSGSFNPLHEGHIALVQAAITALSAACPQDTSSDDKATAPPVVFEIAAVNADKPPLSVEEISRRVRDIADSPLLSQAGLTNVALCITSQPLFASKSKLFPNCTFVMGADTLSRLLDTKYYDNCRDTMIATLTGMLGTEEHGSDKSPMPEVVVGGRVEKTGEFTTCESLLEKAALPKCMCQKFLGMPESLFRCDISSTEIRNRKSVS